MQIILYWALIFDNAKQKIKNFENVVFCLEAAVHRCSVEQLVWYFQKTQRKTPVLESRFKSTTFTPPTYSEIGISKIFTFSVDKIITVFDDSLLQ